MNSPQTEIVLRSANDLVGAIKAMLMQMNRKQRKGFLQWVKEQRTTFDFRYPEGYKPPVGEPVAPVETVIVPDGVSADGKVEIIKP